MRKKLVNGKTLPPASRLADHRHDHCRDFARP
jgi:hypothetical protein